MHVTPLNSYLNMIQDVACNDIKADSWNIHYLHLGILRMALNILKFDDYTYTSLSEFLCK